VCITYEGVMGVGFMRVGIARRYGAGMTWEGLGRIEMNICIDII